MALSKGYIQLYTGDGKGKSTAALGLAMRAVARGLSVHMIQFMKNDPGSAEMVLALAHKNLFKVDQAGRKNFVDKKNPDPGDIAAAQNGLSIARDAILKSSADMIILDEINVAVDFGLISLRDLSAILDMKPENVEIVLTGRGAPDELKARADLVTEMREIKHYYAIGVDAREGIEF